MSKSRFALAILLSFFMLGADSVSQAVGASEEVSAEVDNRDLRGSLTDAFAVLSNPEIEDSVKSTYIDDLFQAVDERCQANCENVLRNLGDINLLAESKTAQALLSGFQESDRESPAGMLEINPSVIGKIQDYMSKQDPRVLQFRISASMELLRYVISLREKSLFSALSSSDPKGQVRTMVQQDIRRLTKQLKALSRIGGILVRKTNFLQGRQGITIHLRIRSAKTQKKPIVNTSRKCS
jgi:hypothetical protein